jgi:hypothetical protein
MFNDGVNMNKQLTPAGRQPIFALPFTREQIRLDLQNIVLGEMRKLRHMSDMDAALPFLSSIDSHAFWDPSSTPEEIGIKYEQISKYTLVEACEDYFDYGFYAVTGTRSEPLKWDSIHTWIGAYLVDLSRSNYFTEWGQGEGHQGLLEGVKRCTFLCELANARVVLEGGDDFYHFSGLAKDEDFGIPGLSIRQLALLAGMEEMSLRSYISRKTTPVLEVSKSDRKTYVEIEVAKQWLKDKGRYCSVQTGRGSADIDLSVTTFDDFNAFLAMLRDRLSYVKDQSDSHTATDHAVTTFLKNYGIEGIAGITLDLAANDALFEKLAETLDLPAGLLKHRAKEAALKTEIWLRQYELKQLQQLSFT